MDAGGFWEEVETEREILVVIARNPESLRDDVAISIS
jgi:hypothetical protein